jgi:two-component system sensor histidine kinase GlrK
LVLQSQIEDLLRFNAAAFEARTLSPRPVQLAELVDEVIADQRLQWQNKQLAVSNEGAAALVEIDREKFATAIANLLSNAIRFSPPGGSVRFRREQSPEGVVLEIADDGPGIAEEDRERIFEPFYRGRVQPESGLRGSGIGLSIVQEYIRAHGGRIMLMPAEKGARFRIEIPHVKAA